MTNPNRNKLKAPFELILRGNGISIEETEYMFAHATVGRKWKFDYAWPSHRVAVELEGGVWVGKGHAAPVRFIGDCEKYNRASLDGWMLLRYTVTDINKSPGRIVEELREALGKGGLYVQAKESKEG